MLTIGMKAPDFTLMNQDHEPISLSNFQGKKVVLYFYAKDHTPGCTRQSAAFAKYYQKYQELGVTIIGISRDSVASHRQFADKNKLPFILLSDPDRKVIESYGVWQEKKMYGKTAMGIARSTFIIDENGWIEKVMPHVKPDTNAEDVLSFLE